MTAKKPDWDVLREAARLLGCATHAAYMCTLRGDVPVGSSKNFEPAIGKMIMEISSFYWSCAVPFERDYDPINSIGVWEREEQEPVFTPEQWAEGGGEDEPIPTERVIYIRTLDGREFRWVNANFIRVPDTTGFKAITGPANFQFKKEFLDKVS